MRNFNQIVLLNNLNVRYQQSEVQEFRLVHVQK